MSVFDRFKKSDLITPHFDEAVEGQKMGNVSFSLLYPPSTEEHAELMEERAGRKLFFDINKSREDNEEQLIKIGKEYSQPVIVEVVRPDERYKVGLRIVNKEAKNGAIGVLGSWSTDADWLYNQGIIEALALMYPDMQIVFIETPGMGDSDKLTKARRKELVNTGSYRPMAEQIAPALDAAGVKLKKVVGPSEGGRIAISLAGEMGIESVITLDPPGTDEQSPIMFAKHFGIDEGKAQKRVLEATPDTLMAHYHKTHDSKVLGQHVLKALDRGLLSRGLALARNGLYLDVTAACSNGATIYDYRSGASAVGSAKYAAEMAEIIVGYNAIELPNAPHAIVEANPLAVGQLFAQAEELHKWRNNTVPTIDPTVLANIGKIAV